MREVAVFREASQRICNALGGCIPLGVPADLQSAVKKCSTFSLRICNPLQLVAIIRQFQKYSSLFIEVV